MFSKKTYYLVAIVFSVIFITFLHLLILQKQSPDVVLEELYYIPILFGALFFGLKGSLLIFLFASLSYLPFFTGSWAATFLDLIDRILHLLFTGVFALLAGLLINRDRKLQKQIERDKYLKNIGQVATTIVHDLKNPLIVILGFAKRIFNEKGDIKASAQTIIESAENMQKVVFDVLDFSKPIKLDLKSEDIGSVIQKACDYCKPKADKSGISMIINIPDQKVETQIDTFAFQRALINLINNSIEASKEGQKVFISLERRKNHYRISIKDSGVGMDEETLENIFTPFYTRKSGGTGLGLPIARKIIEGHKGKVRVYSKVEAGTEIVIELPHSKSI